MMLKNCDLAAEKKYFLRPFAMTDAILRVQRTTLKLLSLINLLISYVMCLNYEFAILGTDAALTNYYINFVF